MLCENCNSLFGKKRPHNAGRFCSLRCYQAFRKKREKLKNDLDGLTSKRRHYRDNKERYFIQQKKYVLEHLEQVQKYKKEWYRKKSALLGVKPCPKKISVSCRRCGKELKLQPNQINKNNYCNLTCRNMEYKKRFGEKAARWKGGRLQMESGYVGIYVHPEDWIYPMRSAKPYVLEHRKIMAEHLGRLLERWEVVHHKNGIKNDNRIENLALLSGKEEHNTLLNKEIIRLTKENKILREQILILEKKISHH